MMQTVGIYAFVTLLFAPLAAGAASGVFTELMYDLPGSDSDREWVEVQNTGAEPVSFASWKLLENMTNHGLSLFRGEATSTPGAFVVIADDPVKFLADWPTFSGTLFDSSFSLGNSGETLALKLDGVVIDQIAYGSATGAAGDGNSLQKSGGQWSAAPPTPGAPSSGAPSPAVDAPPASSSPETFPAASPSAPSSPPPPPPPSGGGGADPWKPRMFVHAKLPATAVAGADLLFEAAALGQKQEPLQSARFLWSFGDGGMAEGKRVYHAYHYPAAYVVMVEASSGELSATDRADIAVAPPLLSISRVKEGTDGFIELTNSGNADIELSRWFLASGGAFFAFPQGTVVKAGGVVPFPSAITKLAAGPDATLLYPNGTAAARYASGVISQTNAVPPAPVAPNETVVARTGTLPTVPPLQPREVPRETAPPLETTKPAEEITSSLLPLHAAAVGSSRSAALWFLSAAALTLVAAGGYVALLRNRRASDPREELRKEAAEFEIVE